MQINIAPCGLICSKCDAFRATQANDPAMLERVAEHWRKLNNCDDIKAEFIPCDGCMNDCGRKSFYCQNMCELRACAIKNGVQVCSECKSFPCDILKAFLANAPEKQAAAMKKLLESIAELEKQTPSVL